jgi:hypothetical protein
VILRRLAVLSSVCAALLSSGASAYELRVESSLRRVFAEREKLTAPVVAESRMSLAAGEYEALQLEQH